jgi:hypothetical protein
MAVVIAITAAGTSIDSHRARVRPSLNTSILEQKINHQSTSSKIGTFVSYETSRRPTCQQPKTEANKPPNTQLKTPFHEDLHSPGGQS